VESADRAESAGSLAAVLAVERVDLAVLVVPVERVGLAVLVVLGERVGLADRVVLWADPVELVVHRERAAREVQADPVGLAAQVERVVLADLAARVASP